MGLLRSNQISRVKVLGVCTGAETKVLTTWNNPIYSLLVEYTNGDRHLVECEAKEMAQYLYYINMDY